MKTLVQTVEQNSRCVLVTGGAGYIGSQAAWALLGAGWRVVVLDDLSTGCMSNVPGDCTFVAGDVADETLIQSIISAYSVVAVLHFAGSVVVPESMSQPVSYYVNNTMKTLVLGQVCALAGVRVMIFSSTAAVYAAGPEEPVAESGQLGPISPYGRSKLMSEEMLADIARTSEMKVGVMRYFNVAGADALGRSGQRKANATHLITVACQVALGIRAVLPIYGTDFPTRDGTCIRDYVHVGDLADAHVLLLEYLLAGGESVTLNCGYGRGISVLEVVREVERLAGKMLPVSYQSRRDGDPPSVIANVGKLNELLDWRPRFPELPAVVSSALEWERRLLRERT